MAEPVPISALRRACRKAGIETSICEPATVLRARLADQAPGLPTELEATAPEV